MPGNLFPVKIATLFGELDNSQVLSRMHHTAQMNPVASPEDGLMRILLSSPEVRKEVRRLIDEEDKAGEYKDQSLKVRIATLQFALALADTHRVLLEVYDESGRKRLKALPLIELDDALANAVQVELLTDLLRSHSVFIPLA